MTKNVVAVLVLLFLPTNILFAQDDVAKKLIDSQAEQIQSLKDQVTELKEANKILAGENAKLKEEIEQQTTSGTKKPAASKARKLSDIFIAGAVFTRKGEHVGGPSRGTAGSGTFTITSRDGNSFTAVSTWVLNDRDKTNGTAEIKGTIVDGNSARWKVVDGPTPNQSTATLRPDGLYIDVQSRTAKGEIIKAVLTVPE